MRTRHLLLALTALTLISIGIAWASAGEAAPAPVEPATQPTEEPEIETESPDDVLEAIAPDTEHTGACCIANCQDEMSQCMAECGPNMACRAACREAYRACADNC